MAEGKGVADLQSLEVSKIRSNFDYQQIGRWLSFSADPVSVEDFLANIILYPHALPLSVRELEFQQALIREIIRSDQKEEEVDSLVVSDEVLKICRSPQEGLSIVLDGYLPQGIVKVFSMTEDGLKVATAICFEGEIGRGKKGDQIAEVVLDFGLAQKQKVLLEEDDLVLIPARAEDKVIAQIKCFKNFKIGGKKDFKVEVTGGAAGIVFDTRGRPFKFPDFSAEGRIRLVRWRKALGII